MHVLTIALTAWSYAKRIVLLVEQEMQTSRDVEAVVSMGAEAS